MQNQHKIFGSALLVAGTAIGAGMLALPITTTIGGTWAALTLLILCFLFMLINVFILLEACFYSPKKQANIISVVHACLGPWATGIAWLTYLLLLYAVLAAYIAGSGELIAGVLANFGWQLSPQILAVIFTALFSIIIYSKTRGVDHFNRIFMLCIFASFLLLCVGITVKADFEFITPGKPKYLWSAIPVVILAYTSHLIVPSIKEYLGNDVKRIKKALLLGCLIPFLLYLTWEVLLIATLPATGPFSLMAIAQSKNSIVAVANVLSNHLGIASIMFLVIVFSFSALASSFLGASLSLIDFLIDGLQMSKTTKGRLSILSMSIIPPLLFALFFPYGFVLALGYAGIFVAILFGILPILVLWESRYRKKLSSPYCAPVGKTGLILLLLMSVAIIFLQLATTFGWLPSIK
ncbi:MAG: aromatic amino acid transport family protein [Gammaproteobacteria bacterium]